jgi:thiol:disulfide interchange protein DsbC
MSVVSFVRRSGFFVMALVCGVVTASEAPDIKQIQSVIAARFPQIIVEGVHKSTDLPGFYEVVTPEEIAYVDMHGTKLIMGSVMDLNTRTSLTAKRWNELHRIDFSSLPFDNAIKLVHGDGRRKLAIFEDPFCPYCAELERTLPQLENVTIYVFLYPLEEVHPGATEAAEKLWCTEDRSAAWVAWIRDEKVSPKLDSCQQNPVAANVILGKELRIHSTPTIFFDDGLRVAGAIEVTKIRAKLDSGKTTQ